jgi:plasmid stabilization system protein ParE
MTYRLSTLAEQDLEEIWSYVDQAASPTRSRLGWSQAEISQAMQMVVRNGQLRAETDGAQASPNRRRKSARSGWNTDDLCSAERA